MSKHHCIYCKVELLPNSPENIESKEQFSREHIIPMFIWKQMTVKPQPITLSSCKGCNNALGGLNTVYDSYMMFGRHGFHLKNLRKCLQRLKYNQKSYFQSLAPIFEELLFVNQNPQFLMSIK